MARFCQDWRSGHTIAGSLSTGLRTRYRSYHGFTDLREVLFSSGYDKLENLAEAIRGKGLEFQQVKNLDGVPVGLSRMVPEYMETNELVLRREDFLEMVRTLKSSRGVEEVVHWMDSSRS